MKRVVLLAILVACVGCDSSRTSPIDPVNDAVVVGKCRFCGKPGYSTNNWISPADAQQVADEGDKQVLGTIVCGACRKGMGAPK
jgi:hypothetical protein